MFRISLRKKGITTKELANEYGITQKTSWLFTRKAQEAMKSSRKHLLTGHVKVDELMIGGIDNDERGRSKGDKKLVIMVVEKVAGDNVGRAYVQTIEDASAESFNPFFEKYIDKDNAQVKTDEWRS